MPFLLFGKFLCMSLLFHRVYLLLTSKKVGEQSQPIGMRWTNILMMGDVRKFYTIR